ncbi:MAG TPA: GntR family transcriptional regulator, partial [Bacteroidia bacterium]
LKNRAEVDLLIEETTDLGVNVIINDRFKGLIHRTDIFQDLKYGERKKGFIKLIREDKKIDVCLQLSGYENILPNEQKILALLKEQKGFLPLNDYSSPDEIKAVLGMSKKVFKKAVGSLFKQRVIRIEEKGISLVR